MRVGVGRYECHIRRLRFAYFIAHVRLFWTNPSLLLCLFPHYTVPLHNRLILSLFRNAYAAYRSELSDSAVSGEGLLDVDDAVDGTCVCVRACVCAAVCGCVCGGGGGV